MSPPTRETGAPNGPGSYKIDAHHDRRPQTTAAAALVEARARVASVARCLGADAFDGRATPPDEAALLALLLDQADGFLARCAA